MTGVVEPVAKEAFLPKSCAVEFDLDSLAPDRRYKILSGLVTPRPIAWVTTIDDNNVVNAAPFSFFNVFGSRPPLVAFAPGNKDADTPKDTARNIKNGSAMVIHLLDEPLVDAMVATAAPLPFGQSELEGLGLTLETTETSSVPRITEAPVAMEAAAHSIVEIGRNRLVLAVVSHLHVRDGLMDAKGNLRAGKYHPIGRMASPDNYCRTIDQFQKARPE